MEYFGKDAFNGCYELAKVEINSKSIDLYLFADSYNLKEVVIGNNVETIEQCAFMSCDALTEITIPNSVTSIGSYAFDRCAKLKNVVIGRGVKTIEECAFRGCALTEITIPNSVTSIGSDAFSSCESLSNIYVQWSTPIKYDYFFDGWYTEENATLYVPKGSLSAYKSADGWNGFVNIQEF